MNVTPQLKRQAPPPTIVSATVYDINAAFALMTKRVAALEAQYEVMLKELERRTSDFK